MVKRSDTPTKLQALQAFLSGVESATSKELSAHLGVSQPVVSRLVAQLGDAVWVAGKARATRYAWRRSVAGVEKKGSGFFTRLTFSR